MNTPSEHYDIIIVGAGLVGATLACAIAQQTGAKPVRIALIEARNDFPQFEGSNFDPRVVALTLASQKLFTDIGVWQWIVERRVCAYREMEVWDGEGNAKIHFSSGEVRQPCLGHIVESSVIVSALQVRVAQCPNITSIQPASVVGLTTGEITTIELDNGLQLTSSLLIAADGAQSKLRELAGFETREWDYGQKAIITTVETELPHQVTAWQRFMHTGPLAFLPLPDVDGKHFCSIVWSADQTFADQLMALNEIDFCSQLASAIEHKLGAIHSIAERVVIPLKQRHAKTYIQPGIALAGDAAHNIHPLAGQGVNLGLLDVAALAQEIARALERGIPLDDFSILRRYQRQRMADNLIMMSAMEAFKRLFGNRSLIVGWLRNTGIRQLNSLAALKKIIVKAAMGLH